MLVQRTLTLAYVPMKHIFEVEESSKEGTMLQGIEAKLLETLSQHLHFQFRLVSPEDGQWGYQKSAGNWTGIIGMLARSEADMGLGYLSITENRTRFVDFSIPYDVLDRTFATEKPEFLSTVSSYMYPFSAGVWLVSLLLFLVVLPLFWFFLKKKRSWVSIAVNVFGSMCRQPMNIEDTSCEWRILFGFWWAYVTFLTLAYSMVLLSFLTVPLRAKGIESLQELSEAVQNEGYRCLAAKGSADKEFLLKSQLEYVNVIGDAITKNMWLYDPMKGLPFNLGKKTALIGARMRMHIAYGSPPYSTKHISDYSFGVSQVGIALKKDFCCSAPLNTLLLRILSSGLYQKWVDDEVFLSKIKRRSLEECDSKQDVSLSLNELQGIFILLVCGYVVAGLIFLYEIKYGSSNNVIGVDMIS